MKLLANPSLLTFTYGHNVTLKSPSMLKGGDSRRVRFQLPTDCGSSDCDTREINKTCHGGPNKGEV